MDQLPGHHRQADRLVESRQQRVQLGLDPLAQMSPKAPASQRFQLSRSQIKARRRILMQITQIDHRLDQSKQSRLGQAGRLRQPPKRRGIALFRKGFKNLKKFLNDGDQGKRVFLEYPVRAENSCRRSIRPGQYAIANLSILT